MMTFLCIFFEEYSNKFHYPRVSPGDQPLTKSRRKLLEKGNLEHVRTQSHTLMYPEEQG